MLTARRRSKKKKIAIRTKKVFTYRGHTAEELLRLSREDLMKIMPSRIRRTLRRGLAPEHLKLLKHIRDGREKVRTHCRDMPVLPEMIGKVVSVHAGKEWKDVHIVPEMVGHYLGEFAPTRAPVRHSGPGVGATRSSKYMPLK